MATKLFVNGTLMRGLSLHSHMGDSKFLGEVRTAPCYRLHSINDHYPGMYRLNPGEAGGASILGEMYQVVKETLDSIVKGEPPHITLGHVLLEDGQEVPGMVIPRVVAEFHYPDITSFGDWRKYMDSKQIGAL